MTVARSESEESKNAAVEPSKDWVAVVAELGEKFAERAEAHDETDSFVAENYAELKEAGVFAAGVPIELGGGGAGHRVLCDMLRELARHCPSTALAVSMHTHLVAAAVWRWRNGQPAEALLRKVATDQPVLVSTGATDWVDSNGTVERVEGGYRVNARKVFGSGSPAGGILVTSAAFDDPEKGPSVLHFPVPFSAEGVKVQNDWRTLGMRGTGSHTVLFENVFVPEEAIAAQRPQGEWPKVLNVVVTIAMPLIMSVYRGLAEAASEKALATARKKADDAPHVLLSIGEMENALATTQMAVDAMVDCCDDYAFAPETETANAVLVRKTIAAEAAIRTVSKAMEAAGGIGFYRAYGLERMFRDVQAAPFHPLPEKKQLRFTGRFRLGLDPAG